MDPMDAAGASDHGGAPPDQRRLLDARGAAAGTLDLDGAGLLGLGSLESWRRAEADRLRLGRVRKLLFGLAGGLCVCLLVAAATTTMSAAKVAAPPSPPAGAARAGKAPAKPPALFALPPAPAPPGVEPPAPSLASPVASPALAIVAPITEAEFLDRLKETFLSPQQAFTSMDVHKHGYLVFNDFVAGMKGFKRPLDDTQAMYAFKGFDADNDHQVLQKEFFGVLRLEHFFQTPQDIDAVANPLGMPPMGPQAVPPPLPTAPPPAPAAEARPTLTVGRLVRQMGAWASEVDPEATFRHLDSGNNGFITPEEFSEKACGFNPTMVPAAAAAVFKGFDANYDGKVSLAEFVGAVTMGRFFRPLALPAATSAALAAPAAPAAAAPAAGRAGPAAGPAARPAAGGPEPTPTPPVPAHAYDCDESLSNSKAEWSEQNKIWCCDHEKKGCDGGSSVPPEAMHPKVWKASQEPMTLPVFVKRLQSSSPSPREAFSSLDADGDEFVDRGEFTAGVRRFTTPLSAEEADYAFSGFDVDGDGFLCQSEFFGVLRGGRFFQTPESLKALGVTIKLPAKKSPGAPSKPPAADPPSVRATPLAAPITAKELRARLGASRSLDSIFDALDAHPDGAVDLHEYRSGLRLRPPLTKVQLLFSFRGMDANQDQRLTRKEFVGTLQLRHFFQAPADVARAREETRTAAKEPQTTGSPAKSKTTSKEVWEEVEHQPITLGDFAKRMGPSFPGSFRVLDSADGCIYLHDFRKASREFDPPLTDEEANYAFCGFDENHDRKVCSEEFLATLKVGHLFADHSHLEAVKEVGALEEPRTARQEERPGELAEAAPAASAMTAAPTGSPATTSTAAAAWTHGVRVASLAEYQGVPAIVNGRAEVTLHLASPEESPVASNMRQEVSRLLQEGLGQQLSLRINIADAEVLAGEASHDKTIVLLWTGGAVEDGGSLQTSLHNEAASIERAVRDTVVQGAVDRDGRHWLRSATVWLHFSSSYYGPGATRLPHGKKLRQNIGRRQGGASETGSPPFVVN